MVDYIREVDMVMAALVSAGISANENNTKCTSDEINCLESKLKMKLPAAYRYFLEKMGHGFGDFYQGTDWTFDRLGQLLSEARLLLDECGSEFRLTDSSFVFSMHQGYSFLFFTGNECNPPVNVYVEFEKPVVVANCFTEWLRKTAEDQIRYHMKFGEDASEGFN